MSETEERDEVTLVAGRALAGLAGARVAVDGHTLTVPEPGARVAVPAAVALRLLSQAGWHRPPAPAPAPSAVAHPKRGRPRS